MSDDERLVLVDALEATPIVALGDDGVQRGIELKIGGRLNRDTERVEAQFVMAPGQVDILIDQLMLAREVAGGQP